MGPRALLAVFVTVVSLALPGQAAASAYWEWGYNWVGQYLNNPVTSGFNYWDDQYVDIANLNAGYSYGGWDTPDGRHCHPLQFGVGSYYYEPDRDCTGGWGGWYIHNKVGWNGGTASYLWVDSWNY